jgi:hypothetical protein
MLRLKAAKHGFRLDNIVPVHKPDYFLPDKVKYIVKAQ